ncbi:MAG: hypothetical protein QF412_07765 [Planctomycetota bacterium]|jgi:hypothetical protein|nr:hypothetical protein [Planctomycetota bacterium]
MELDFDAVGEETDYVTVPAGTYLCRVEEVRQRSTKAGDDLWALRLLVDEGEFQGRHAAWDNLIFSTRGRARVRRVFAALGLPTQGKVRIEPDELAGRRAFVEVRPVAYEDGHGQTIRRNEVPYEGYRALAETGEAPAEDAAPRGGASDIPF